MVILKTFPGTRYGKAVQLSTMMVGVLKCSFHTLPFDLEKRTCKHGDFMLLAGGEKQKSSLHGIPSIQMSTASLHKKVCGRGSPISNLPYASSSPLISPLTSIIILTIVRTKKIGPHR